MLPIVIMYFSVTTCNEEQTTNIHLHTPSIKYYFSNQLKEVCNNNGYMTLPICLWKMKNESLSIFHIVTFDEKNEYTNLR